MDAHDVFTRPWLACAHDGGLCVVALVLLCAELLVAEVLHTDAACAVRTAPRTARVLDGEAVQPRRRDPLDAGAQRDALHQRAVGGGVGLRDECVRADVVPPPPDFLCGTASEQGDAYERLALAEPLVEHDELVEGHGWVRGFLGVWEDAVHSAAVRGGGAYFSPRGLVSSRTSLSGTSCALLEGRRCGRRYRDVQALVVAELELRTPGVCGVPRQTGGERAADEQRKCKETHGVYFYRWHAAPSRLPTHSLRCFSSSMGVIIRVSPQTSHVSTERRAAHPVDVAARGSGGATSDSAASAGFCVPLDAVARTSGCCFAHRSRCSRSCGSVRMYVEWQMRHTYLRSPPTSSPS